MAPHQDDPEAMPGKQKAKSRENGTNGKNDEKTPDAGRHDGGARAILRENALEALVRAFLSLRTPDEGRKFLTDLCTHQELRALSERLVIARLLEAGDMSYRDISAATGASTTTVGRVARFLQHEPHQGYRVVIERLGGVSDEQHGPADPDRES